MQKDIFQESLELHKKYRGKIETQSKVPLRDKNDLSLAYTPGVAEPCRAIYKDKDRVFEYTNRGNTVAIVTDGSAVLGLGNIGPEAALPVMEGKAAIFKRFAGIDAVPICLATQDTEEIIRTVKYLEPNFGGINLEDIAAPRCFEIEERLKAELNIPIMHDDQHGTAIVVLAGLINALRITGKSKDAIRVVINGAGAAGTATALLLNAFGIGNIIVCDRKGALASARTDLNTSKKALLQKTNPENVSGDLKTVIKGADVFIGVSTLGMLNADDVRTMNADPILFALSNPTPEIMPDEARAGGARIIATGRSDFPNQVNNALAYPGIFRGVLDARASAITEEMKLASAVAIADLVSERERGEMKIIPDIFDDRVVAAVSGAVREKIARP
ncbi:MAG: NADP-dependent malic enzyme [Patescibacteria group bacterium]